jgi:hypothetical protein
MKRERSKDVRHAEVSRNMRRKEEVSREIIEIDFIPKEKEIH